MDDRQCYRGGQNSSYRHTSPRLLSHPNQSWFFSEMERIQLSIWLPSGQHSENDMCRSSRNFNDAIIDRFSTAKTVQHFASFACLFCSWFYLPCHHDFSDVRKRRCLCVCILKSRWRKSLQNSLNSLCTLRRCKYSVKLANRRFPRPKQHLFLWSQRWTGKSHWSASQSGPKVVVVAVHHFQPLAGGCTIVETLAG